MFFLEDKKNIKKIQENINIDWDLVSRGLSISTESAIKFMSDGRVAGRYFEFLIKDVVKENFPDVKVERSPSEKDPYDIEIEEKERIEIRSLTPRGCFFAPSSTVGVGRVFTKEKMEQKMSQIDGYLFVDTINMKNGKVNLFFVTIKKIIFLSTKGVFGKGKFSYKKFLEFFN